ncbi:DUF4374 domain-containing protein [Olivibacter sp. 47]|jgi:hypothetical protein|uniref:DUF4374 domain-containing protein n=1 Tax=Olivibacter sp. 47 TaxID=3056486 RepID=UPI0025A43203|nr:DUF4374 domain-containing protein [Olivibacter sp. 47]MDM8174056.1 DUF4374 domain-containing protein [Olivibacter sp. 47]
MNMIQFNTFKKNSWLLGLAVFGLTACSKSDGPDTGGGDFNGQKYFIAATTGTATYLLTADDLTNHSDTITTTGNGVELLTTYTTWVNYGTKATVGLYYAQGNPGVGVTYGLASDGSLAPVGNEFLINSRFTTYGTYDHYVLTGVSGQTLDDGSIGSTFNFIDMNNRSQLTQKSINTTNFTGNGDIATFSGIVDLGNGEFLTGVVASGLKEEGSGGGSSTGKVNFPDSVWVAALDADLNVKRIYRDDRLSYSSGRFKSQYYSQIAKDGEGNVYVFSGSYDGTTTKPAGALRINRGAETFDQDYYFNIQEKSGGYRFRNVWYITEDYYLLEFYNSVQYDTNTPATQYAIVKMGDRSFTWLTNGFPSKDQITATGLPFADGGKLYFPVTTDTTAPTIYVIDPTTASATAGLVIQAESVNSVTKLTL